MISCYTLKYLLDLYKQDRLQMVSDLPPRYNDRRSSLLLSGLVSVPFTFTTLIFRSLPLAAVLALQVGSSCPQRTFHPVPTFCNCSATRVDFSPPLHPGHGKFAAFQGKTLFAKYFLLAGQDQEQACSRITHLVVCRHDAEKWPNTQENG